MSDKGWEVFAWFCIVLIIVGLFVLAMEQL